MAHCQVCGSEVPWHAGLPPGAPAAVCPRCGTPWGEASPSRRAQATLLGGISVPGAVPTRPQAAQRTLMGIAKPFGDVPATHRSPGEEQNVTRTQLAGTPLSAAAAPRHSDDTRPGFDPLADPANAATIVDVPVFETHGLSGTMRMQPVPAPPSGAPPSRSGGTLLGVARPGIAPLRPGVSKTPIEEPAPPSYRPLEELGATQQVPPVMRRRAEPAVKVEGNHPLGKRRFDKAIRVDGPKREKRPAKSEKRAWWLLALAPVLVVLAIVTVVLWPSAPPLTAQVRSGEGGLEVLDVTCESCPDGTTLTVRDAEGKVAGGRASLPLELKIGDTPLKVKIDRPGSGRDETVSLPVRVAYRIRPDLTTLEADRPSLQIVIEAMPGATVSLDGEDVPLRDGRAIKTVDVSRDVTGPSADVSAQLSRRIDFTVKPPDGPEEKGAVAVSVPLLPLTIDAPGRAIVTEKATFLLSGKTSPGAEISVAGRSLGVQKDGYFSQTMNVSSVGATEIEVRAKTPGRAPRLVRVAVERVTSLEAAADAFAKRGPLGYSQVAKAIEEAVGKPVQLTGEVLELREENGINVIILSAEAEGCAKPPAAGCVVRLVQGRTDLELERGSRMRAFGVVNGPVPHQGRTTFDVDVAFAIPDKRNKDGSK